MVVIYKMNRLSSWIGKRLIRVDHVAMPNLIARRRIVPELILEACNSQAIATEIARFLDDDERVAELRRGLAEVVRRLGEPGVFERAAERVLSWLSPSSD
jgi:lipid-A-disaccharide synthase